MKYLWKKNNDQLEIINDPIDLYKSGEFNEKTDKIYQIGSEIEIEIKIKTKNQTRSILME